MPDVSVSALSARHKNQEAITAIPASPRFMQVGVALQARQGVALTSKKVCVIPANTRLRVMDSRVWREDGTLRLCVGSADSEASGDLTRRMLPIGWVTSKPGMGASPDGASEADASVAATRSSQDQTGRSTQRDRAQSIRTAARLEEIKNEKEERMEQRTRRDRQIDERMDARSA